MSSIVLDRVSRNFGSTVALNEVSIDVPDGAFLVLLGPSGCGKSTLLRVLAGLIAPTSGRVIIDDRDVTALPPGDRDIAMVFQSYALYPHMSVEKNLGFGLHVRHFAKTDIAARVRAVADQLKLGELLHRKPKELSGGERQRVALGRAVVRNPQAFLMDEPLSNLDAQLRTATRLELIELHRRLASTFVYVTHDQIEAMTMATQIVVMNGGRVEQIGTPANIYDEPASTFVARFIGAPPMNLLPAVVRSEGGKVRVVAEGIEVDLYEGSIPERPVLLGVRPEHLTLSPRDHTGSGLIGKVTVVENLGSEEVAFCEVGATQVAVRGPRPLALEPGQFVRLAAPKHRYFLFDPLSTRRLVWVDDQQEAHLVTQKIPATSRG